MDDDVQALAALQVPGALSNHVRLRSMSICPHCHEGFGSASLPIHVKRCRALYPSTEEEVAEKPKPKKKEIRPLVDLCLRFVTKHFESICMEKIVAFPEAEAALIASMPSTLVHRMVVNLVKDSKRVKQKHSQMQAKIETLERSLQSARRDAALLESARDGEAMMRTRLGEQQQVAQQLDRELDATKAQLAAAEADNRQLQSKVEGAAKLQLRLEAKINSLKADKGSLKKAATAAQQREMQATRQLASVKRLSGTTVSKAKARPSMKSTVYQLEEPKQAGRGNQERRRTNLFPSSRDAANPSWPDPAHTAPVIVHERPRSDGSKIPYPRSCCRRFDRLSSAASVSPT